MVDSEADDDLVSGLYECEVGVQRVENRLVEQHGMDLAGMETQLSGAAQKRHRTAAAAVRTHKQSLQPTARKQQIA